MNKNVFNRTPQDFNVLLLQFLTSFKKKIIERKKENKSNRKKTNDSN